MPSLALLKKPTGTDKFLIEISQNMYILSKKNEHFYLELRMLITTNSKLYSIQCDSKGGDNNNLVLVGAVIYV